MSDVVEGAVLLEPAGPARPTEYGKRWLDRWVTNLERFCDVLQDVARLAEFERAQWSAIERQLRAEGVPVAVTSGLSKYAMQHILDHSDGKTAWTMPATVALALATAAPTSSTTGATLTEASYTGYAEVVIAGAGFNASTNADPSVSTNNGAITFGNCTAGTSTLLGFLLKDSSAIGAGNALWYGSLASTVISTTQTPPTIADQAMSLSLTGT